MKYIHTYIHTNLYSAKNCENESEAGQMTRLQVMQLPLVSALGFRVRSRQMSATVIPGGRRLGGNKCPTPARSSERSTDGLCVCGTDSCWRAQGSVYVRGVHTFPWCLVMGGSEAKGGR